MTREESPWYCKNCRHWVGWKRPECACGREEPRWPLRYDDVDFDHSHNVTAKHRLKGIWLSLRGDIRELLTGER
jgi:hypothetical protein